MAFKRLRVVRSPGAIWFGAIVFVFAFGGAQASGDGKFWRPQYMGGIGYVYTALMMLGAYCVFRGIYGEFWMIVKVDTAARKLMTCKKEVIGFDDLGALEIAGTRLLAKGAKTPVYLSSESDLRQVKTMIEGLVDPARPTRLFRLRRLAYHRLPALFVLALLGFAALVGVFFSEAHTMQRSFSYEPEFKLMWLLGMAVSIAWMRLGLFGTLTKNQLRVDPDAGVLQDDAGNIFHFDQIGELSIVKRPETNRTQRRTTTIMNFDLKCSGLEGTLFTDFWNEKRTQLRFDALSTAMLQFKLRRVLEAPQVEGDAFRSGLDPHAEAKRIAADSPFKRAALEALTRDPDPTVRTRAAALL